VKKLIKIIAVLSVVLSGVHAGASSDGRAGYHDGCRSAHGHYTRSTYKYKHSKTYHRQWRKGKRSCAHPKKKVIRHRHRAKHVTLQRSCKTQVSWEAFRQGWQHGNRSARGHFYVDRSGCAAYRQGWVNGYRDCHCGEHKKPDSYAEGYYAGCSSTVSLKIRDNYYYKTRAGYRHGWVQGYQDCRGVYR